MNEIVISKRKLIIVSVIVLIIIVLGLIVRSTLYSLVGISSDESMSSRPTLNMSADSSGTIVADNYYPQEKINVPYYGGAQPNISDTREFLKTSYSSTIKTRNVSRVVKDVRNAIKGADGRIDNFYSSEKNGGISFVVAKSKFEELRSEIEGLSYAKLYVENISSQNLLSQKQNIERQASNVLSSLENLQKQKDELGAKHAQAVKTLDAEIARIRGELADVRSTISEETIDSNTRLLLRRQETDLLDQQSFQNQKLSNENGTYASQLKNLESQIANAKSNLNNVNQQDSNFADNIETVNGHVSVAWVSLWQLAKIYSPVSPVVLIIALIIILWIFLRRKGYLPRIVIK